MTTIAEARPFVTGGVDTHLDVHVAAVVTAVGGVLGTAEFPTTAAGYRRLLAWMCGFESSIGSAWRAPAPTGCRWPATCVPSRSRWWRWCDPPAGPPAARQDRRRRCHRGRVGCAFRGSGQDRGSVRIVGAEPKIIKSQPRALAGLNHRPCDFFRSK